MLNILQNVEPSTAQLILSQLTKRFLPIPFESVEEKHDELYFSALAEILRSLHIEQKQPSTEEKHQILALLLKEMSSLALNQEKQNSARERLGSKGDLSPEQYEFYFGDLLPIYKARGISKSEITKTLTRPDAYMHLLRGQEVEENKAPISLYVKTFRHRNENLYLLVQTQRKGYTQNVSTAWKIFASDIGGFEGNNPLDLLKKFVDVFGTELRVGNSPAKKFFLYETVSLISRDITGNTLIRVPADRHLEMQSSIRVSQFGVVEIDILYGINMDKYYGALRAHGIDIKAE